MPSTTAVQAVRTEYQLLIALTTHAWLPVPEGPTTVQSSPQLICILLYSCRCFKTQGLNMCSVHTQRSARKARESTQYSRTARCAPTHTVLALAMVLWYITQSSPELSTCGLVTLVYRQHDIRMLIRGKRKGCASWTDGSILNHPKITLYQVFD